MELKDKVWFTYKARIRTTERLQANNTHSQTLLVWYALIATTLSIIAIRYPQVLGPDTDITLAVMTVALLVISLLVTNSDYRGRALQMNRNYLELQRLYNSLSASVQISADSVNEYSRLLDQVENHSSLDDKYWRVRFEPNTTRPVNCREKFDIYCYILIRFGILLVLYGFPILVAVWLIPSK